MRKICLLLLFSWGASAWAQDTLKIPIDTRVIRSIVQKYCDSLAANLDSVVKYRRTTTGTTVLNADTLGVRTDSTITYQLAVDAKNPADATEAWGVRSVTIQNKGGTLQVLGIRNLDGSGFAGSGTAGKCTWTVSVVNNFAILKLTGTGTGPVYWYMRKLIL